MPDAVVPIHEPERDRFTVTEDGQVAVVDYTIDRGPEAGVMVITHTLVPRSLEGRGIAGALVRAALDHARAQGLKVQPACSYADAWMRRHPDYDTLRA